MADISTCPLPELVQHFRDAADKCDERQELLKCLLMNSIANRFKTAHDDIEELKRTLAGRDKEARDRLKRIEELEELHGKG